MVARLITPPAEEPVGLTETRSWAKIDDDIDEVILKVAIQAGREKVEQITGLRLMKQVWAVRAKRGQLLLLHGLMPVISIKTADGQDMEWDDGLPAAVRVDQDVELHVECGYATAEQVPAGIKMWIWQRVGYLIEHREALISNLEAAPPSDYVDGLLAPFIVPRL